MSRKLDPTRVVFEGPYPLLYAAEAKVSVSYERIARLLAAIGATELGGVRGKTAMDVGCGYGTLAVAGLAQHPFAHIVAVDRSKNMIDLARAIHECDTPIQAWAYKHWMGDVDHTLGKFRDATFCHLSERRAMLNQSPFRAHGGTMLWRCGDIFDLKISRDEKEVDFLAMNNIFPWLLKQRGGEKWEEDTIVEVLRHLRSLVRRDGVIVIMGPDGFVGGHVGTRLDMSEMYFAWNEKINRLLLERYGIKREMPPRDGGQPIFTAGTFKHVIRRAGLVGHIVTLQDWLLCTNPVDAFHIRAPMWLWKTTMSFVEKRDVIYSVAKDIIENAPEELVCAPLTEQFHFLVLRHR